MRGTRALRRFKAINKAEDISQSASLDTGTQANDPAQVDTAIMIAGEVALILEDTEDEFDFTQLDIY